MKSLLANFPTRRLLGLNLVDANLIEVANALAARSSKEKFSYVVTPNADHFLRLARDQSSLIEYYIQAGAMLLDSRVVHRLASLLGLAAPQVITGSDLTDYLLRYLIAADEPITLVGTTPDAGAKLRHMFGLSRLAHFAPPFGFESEPKIVDECVQFVRAHPSRFVLLACGSPRQELLAHAILRNGGATGVALCIGSAVDQIGGLDKRAPIWLRRRGLEWLWRALRDPNRLGHRYVRSCTIVYDLISERVALKKSLRD